MWHARLQWQYICDMISCSDNRCDMISCSNNRCDIISCSDNRCDMISCSDNTYVTWSAAVTKYVTWSVISSSDNIRDIVSNIYNRCDMISNCDNRCDMISNSDCLWTLAAHTDVVTWAVTEASTDISYTVCDSSYCSSRDRSIANSTHNEWPKPIVSIRIIFDTIPVEWHNSINIGNVRTATMLRNYVTVLL